MADAQQKAREDAAFAPPGERTAPQAGAPEDLLAYDAMSKARREALENIRSAAEKWLGTITTLTGLLGLAALFKGREDINELDDTVKQLVFIAVAVGLGFGVAMEQKTGIRIDLLSENQAV